MIHVLQQPQLAERPLSVSSRLKRPVQLLNCDFGASLIVDGRAEEKLIIELAFGFFSAPKVSHSMTPTKPSHKHRFRSAAAAGIAQELP